MKQTIFAFLATIAALIAMPTQALATTYQSQVSKNQFGETSISSIIGGSSIDLSFKVLSTNASGVTNVSAPFGVAAVYMHTSTTPATGNPNPLAGYIVVELTPQFSGYIGSYDAFLSANSGSSVSISSGLTANQVYTIITVGTSTAANWQAIGLPVGVTPAVGVSFVASTSSAGTGTGTVQAPLATGSGVYKIEAIGSPVATSDVGVTGYGSYIMFQALGATSSTSTVFKAVAPADGTIISMHLQYLPTASSLH
jgi:hypothetical protein